ncbi:MAG: GTPase involved in cell partitioning and DNA repair, partial [Paracoccaceae bacterium]
MSNQNFIDYVKISGKSGSGGPGSHSYFRDNL